jgi:hypothetical protein
MTVSNSALPVAFFHCVSCRALCKAIWDGDRIKVTCENSECALPTSGYFKPEIQILEKQ